MRYRLLLFSILIIILMIPVNSSAEERLHLEADNLQYIKDAEIIKAQGVAELDYLNISMRADKIEFDMNKNHIYASGNVIFRESDQILYSEELEHDLDEELTVFLRVRSQLESEKTDDPIYFTSPEMQGVEGRLEIWDSKVTTCDLEDPHYFLQAREVTIYPGDRLTAKNVVFWELNGRLPLFYWPWLTISLKEEQPDFMPSFGYSDQKGWFIKTVNNYFLEKGVGSFYLDYYSRRGLGTGIKHSYFPTEYSKGSLYLYLLQNTKSEQETFDYFQGRFEHNQVFGNWDTHLYSEYLLNYGEDTLFKGGISGDLTFNNNNLSLSGDYEHREIFDKKVELTGDFDGRLNTESSLTAVGTNYDYEKDTEGEIESMLSSYIRYDRRFPSDWDLSLDLNHRERRESEQIQSLIEGHTSLSLTRPAYSWEFLIEREDSFDTDDEDDLAFSRMPEISLSFYPARLYEFSPALDHLLSPLHLTAAAGMYYDDQEDLEAFRGAGKYRYRDSYSLLPNLNLTLRQEGNLFIYRDEYELLENNYFTSSTRASVRHNIAEGLELRTTYDYNFDLGESPFTFDSQRDRNRLSSNLSYRWANHRFRLRSGYDFLNDKYDDIRANLMIKPSEKLEFDFAASYDINTDQFKRLIGRSSFEDEKLALDVALEFDEELRAEQLDTEMSWQLDPDWKLELRSSYDHKKREIDRGEIMLVRDLHCREISFSYNHREETFWVNYHIKAFPEQRAVLGSTPEEPMLFDLELGDLFDEE